MLTHRCILEINPTDSWMQKPLNWSVFPHLNLSSNHPTNRYVFVK